MPQLTIPVNAPVLIPNIGTAELFGLNIGTSTLYYGPDQTVSAATGVPLSPGNAIQNWPVGEPLYITSAVNQGTFAYSSNGAQIAIGAVAASLLPGQSVGINGTAQVAGTVGNQPANTPVLLQTLTIPYTNAADNTGTLTASSTQIDTSGYSSLIVYVTDHAGFASVVPDAVSYVKMLIQGQDGNNGYQLDAYTPQFLPGANGALPGDPNVFGYIQVPTKTPKYFVQATLFKAATPVTVSPNLTIWIYGSHEVIPVPRYESLPTFTIGTPLGDVAVLSSGAASADQVVGTKNGQAQYNVFAINSASTGSSNIQYAENGAWNLLDGTGALPTGGSVGKTESLPMRPHKIHVATSAGLGWIASLQQL